MRRCLPKFTPADRKNHLSGFDKCLYGVSVGANNKSISDLIEGYYWASANFKRCSMLIGDSLYRFTLQIQKGLSPEAAERHARSAGQLLVEQILARLTRVPDIIRCSDVLSTPRFSEYLKEIEALHSKNEIFRESVESDATSFVIRQTKKNRLAIKQKDAIELAISYLIEEITVYGILAEQGWLIDVYLGEELPTLERIICGEIPGLEGPLSKRTNICLRLK